jgi:hypothetical protein
MKESLGVPEWLFDGSRARKQKEPGRPSSSVKAFCRREIKILQTIYGEIFDPASGHGYDWSLRFLRGDSAAFGDKTLGKKNCKLFLMVFESAFFPWTKRGQRRKSSVDIFGNYHEIGRCAELS